MPITTACFTTKMSCGTPGLAPTRTVLQTREFLLELQAPTKSSGVPENVRKEARRLLRHYPDAWHLDAAHRGLPDWWVPVPDGMKTRDVAKPRPKVKVKVKIQLASDLHFEFLQREFPGERLISPAYGADLLVLAGDIGNGTQAIELFRDWPVPVLFLAGNHESLTSNFLNSGLTSTAQTDRHVSWPFH